jgi:hypothetical protein
MHDILNHVYYDDLVYLTEKANVRKLRDYRMQLSITTNPHVKNPKELFKILEQEERRITGAPQLNATMDTAGFEQLKNRLSQNPRFVIK